MNLARQNNSKVLIVLALVFIAPVVLAKLFLTMHWYRGGVTNHGELLPETVSYQSLEMKNPQPHMWQILYLLPIHCDTSCKQQLFVLNQSYLALGKEKKRVKPIIFMDKRSDISQLQNYPFKPILATNSMVAQLDQQQMVVVDPLGKWVMKYGLMTNEHQRVMQGKAMLSDMQKMLKLSRVG